MAYATDHAVLRYIERVLKVDVQAIREMLANPAVDTAAKIGCTTVKLGDGTRLKLQGDVVSTVLGARKHRKRQKGHR